MASSSTSGTSNNRGGLREWGAWSEQLSKSGQRYYYNKETEVSQWEKPEDWKRYDEQQEERERRKRGRSSIPPTSQPTASGTTSTAGAMASGSDESSSSHHHRPPAKQSRTENAGNSGTTSNSYLAQLPESERRLYSLGNGRAYREVMEGGGSAEHRNAEAQMTRDNAVIDQLVAQVADKRKNLIRASIMLRTIQLEARLHQLRRTHIARSIEQLEEFSSPASTAARLVLPFGTHLTTSAAASTPPPPPPPPHQQSQTGAQT